MEPLCRLEEEALATGDGIEEGAPRDDEIDADDQILKSIGLDTGTSVGTLSITVHELRNDRTHLMRDPDDNTGSGTDIKLKLNTGKGYLCIQPVVRSQNALEQYLVHT